ncbi:hypothetical protein RQP50_10215 [Paenibacillus sp. chi10]|uniref:Uncharacterized protein n=1 Tax=Paenibacillus suaedae TaxID=3077233 RepID=A0AAJ2JTV7_9BACL|nr:hypothetical protein [Paenibacillus sp. chi10]MDT8976616.1 hypothetical protein [Paenibacillus sp. chi10]
MNWGGYAIKIPLNSLKAIIIPIVLLGGIYLWFVDSDNVTKEIQIKQIASTEMSKAVYTKEGSGAFINWVDIKLGQDEVENIANWINSVPESEIIELNQIPSNKSINAGIVFKLKINKEIRIQYDLEKIYITRTDLKKSHVVYAINQEELKNFFDTQLKGFYFGEDKVKDF